MFELRTTEILHTSLDTKAFFNLHVIQLLFHRFTTIFLYNIFKKFHINNKLNTYLGCSWKQDRYKQCWLQQISYGLAYFISLVSSNYPNQSHLQALPITLRHLKSKIPKIAANICFSKFSYIVVISVASIKIICNGCIVGSYIRNME